MTKIQLLDLLEDANTAARRAEEGIKAQQNIIRTRQEVGADAADAVERLAQFDRSCQFHFHLVDAILDQLDDAG